jgi:hypothetical protein
LPAFDPRVFASAWAGNLSAVLAAATSFLALAGSGLASSRWLGAAGRRTTLPRSLGLGLGLSGLAVLGLGLAGLLFRPAAIALVALGLAALVAEKEAFRAGFGSMSRALLPLGRENRWLVALAGVAGLASLAMAFGPEGGWDPRYYHLQLPKLYCLRHRIFLVPYVHPSHYPQTVEMLFTLGWLLGGEAPARLLNFLLWPFAGAALFSLALPLGRSTAFRATALALAMPVTAVLAAENYIDLGLSAFALLALGEALAGNMVIAGLFAGFAMGTKYTGVVAAAALAGPLFMRGTGLLPAARAVAAASLPVIPWLARNWFFTGDPVAPFFHGRLAAPVLAGFAQADAGRVIPGLVPPGPFGVIAGALVAPWRFIRTEHFAVFSPFLLGLAPAVLLGPASCREAGIRAWFLLFSLGLLLLAPDGRYWHPGAFPLAVLVVLARQKLSAHGEPWRRALGAFAWVSLASCSAYHVLDMHRTLPAVPLVSAGLLSREEYLLRTRHPRGYMDAVEAVNGAAIPGERVAVFGATEAYLVRSEAVFDCDAPGSRRWLYLLASSGRDEAGFARWFRQRNIRVALHVPGRAAAAAAGETWDTGSEKPWTAFWNSRARLVSAPGDCVVYTLARERGPSGPARDLPGPQDAVLSAMDREASWTGRTRIYTSAIARGLESAHLDAVYGAWTGNDGRYPAAEAALRRAVRLAPSHAPAWYWLTAVLLARHKTGEARDALARGVGADPGFVLRAPLEKMVERALVPKPR